MFETLSFELVYKGGVDLTTQNPTTQDIQSCMAARYDAGICKHRKERTGVIEVEKMEVNVIGQMDHTLDNTFESANRVYDANALSPTLPTGTGGGHIPKILDVEKIPIIKIGEENFSFIYEIDGEYYRIRIRKLTPRECWRLMGFTDEDFERAESVNSNTQLYKQAGNSIVKNVLMAVFKQIVENQEQMC